MFWLCSFLPSKVTCWRRCISNATFRKTLRHEGISCVKPAGMALPLQREGASFLRSADGVCHVGAPSSNPTAAFSSAPPQASSRQQAFPSSSALHQMQVSCECASAHLDRKPARHSDLRGFWQRLPTPSVRWPNLSWHPPQITPVDIHVQCPPGYGSHKTGQCTLHTRLCLGNHQQTG